MSAPSAPSAPSWFAAHRLSLFLVLAWTMLGGWIFAAFLRGKSLRDDDVALPVVALCMVSAVIGSRVWLAFHDHFERSSHVPQPS